MDLKESDILGGAIGEHWYYAAKAKAVQRLLDPARMTRILDVGAGSGYFSHFLLHHTEAGEAWCVDTSYAADSDELRAGKPVHYRRAVASVDADLVLLMDVLEHVTDDLALLKEYVDKARPGTAFLITVPAFQFLWSGHDDFLEHKRRYTLPQIESVARGAGLDVRKGAYYFAMVFPIAAILRLAQRGRGEGQVARSQLTRHHPLVNAVLASLCRIELPWMQNNRTAGLTACCVAVKP